MKAHTRDKRTKTGTWKFIPDSTIPESEIRERQERDVLDRLCVGVQFGTPETRFARGCAAVEEFHDHFPGGNEVPKGGAWILVKTPPPCEFTVPPLSLWFATPWPFDPAYREVDPKRVCILTPRGNLGIFPREYS